MIDALLSYVMVLPAQFLCLLPMRHQLKPGWKKTAIALTVLNAVLLPVAAFITVQLSLDINYVLFPLLLVFFAVYQHLLKCPVSKSISVFLSVSALMAILCNLTCAIEATFDPASGANTLSLQSALIQLALNTLAAAVLFFPFFRYGSRLIDELKLEKIWYMTLPFSGVLIVCNLFIRPLKYETLFVNNVFRSFLFSIFSFLILWNLLCVIYYQIVMGVLNASRTRERMRMLEMQESQFESQQQYMESFARTRHDFRQNILTMKNLYHEGNYDQLGQYIDEYYDALPVPETRRYCSNRALNALLNYYAGKAKENDIPVSFRIDIPQKIAVSDVDLCTIIGNILENAVAASLEIPVENRNLFLSGLVQNNRLYIVATNAFNGLVKQRNGKYLSSRHTGNGIGLKSICASAEKYHGKAAFSHDGKEFHSDVMLLLQPA
ncbi:MAG: sensor histidine kinase [Clostridia bacterium]|nr:sensor histidine kinase [Clostridia bacterium]